MLNNRFYHVALVATNLLLLNLIWLLACIPVITIMPATAATFGVVKEWQNDTPSAIVASFLREFIRNFVLSSVFGTAWVLVGIVIINNYILASGLNISFQLLAATANALITFLYIFTTVFLFPLLVTYQLGWRQLIKYSLVISITRYFVTLRCLVFIASSAALVYFFPPLVLVTGSTTCYVIYQLCSDVFEAIEHERA